MNKWNTAAHGGIPPSLQHLQQRLVLHFQTIAESILDIAWIFHEHEHCSRRSFVSIIFLFCSLIFKDIFTTNRLVKYLLIEIYIIIQTANNHAKYEYFNCFYRDYRRLFATFIKVRRVFDTNISSLKKLRYPNHFLEITK